jgi:16S rRNA (guanine1207-N2)-methyltransferase
MYFENDNTIKSNKQKIKIKYKDLTLEMYTDNGVFSKEKFDYGSRLLLENLPLDKMTGNILDLGCGYGPIGIYLAKKTDTQIDMVDINERAIKLAQENIVLNNINNANAYISDIYDLVNKTYNYIVTNPPIRAGKEIVRKFLINATNHLTDTGELWFVMRKDHGVKSMLKELDNFYKTEIIEKDKGFYVVKCLKK